YRSGRNPSFFQAGDGIKFAISRHLNYKNRVNKISKIADKRVNNEHLSTPLAGEGNTDSPSGAARSPVEWPPLSCNAALIRISIIAGASTTGMPFSKWRSAEYFPKSSRRITEAATAGTGIILKRYWSGTYGTSPASIGTSPCGNLSGSSRPGLP